MAEIAVYRIDETSAEEQRESIIDRLKREAPVFTDLMRRVERTGGLDANLNKAKETSLHYIDGLLDKLNVVELSSIPTLPEIQTEPAIILGEN